MSDNMRIVVQSVMQGYQWNLEVYSNVLGTDAWILIDSGVCKTYAKACDRASVAVTEYRPRF